MRRQPSPQFASSTTYRASLGKLQPDRLALDGRLEFRPRVAIDVELRCRREG